MTQKDTPGKLIKPAPKTVLMLMKSLDVSRFDNIGKNIEILSLYLTTWLPWERVGLWGCNSTPV